MQILFSRKHKQNWAYKTMNKLEIPRTSWTQQRTDIKNKILRETLHAINTIAQQNTTLATAIITNSTIPDVRRWNHLERNGTIITN